MAENRKNIGREWVCLATKQKIVENEYRGVRELVKFRLLRGGFENLKLFHNQSN